MIYLFVLYVVGLFSGAACLAKKNANKITDNLIEGAEWPYTLVTQIINIWKNPQQ